MSSKSVEIISNDDRTPADVDPINEAIVVQDEIHTNIHRGVFFSASRYVAALSDASTVEVLIQVSASQSAHVRFGGAVEVFEDTTFSSEGTTVTARNRNRFSANTADTVITHTPTLTLDGTSLDDPALIPGGTHVNFSPGGQSRSFEEWILSTSKNYLVRLTNTSGNTTPVSVVLDLYEPS